MIAVALWVDEPAGRGRAHDGVRHRAAAARHAGLVVLCLLRSPLRWSGALPDRGRDACWRCARRSRTCWSRPTATAVAVRGARRAARDGRDRQRHLRGPRMARRRRRCAHAEGQDAGRGRRLRRGRLHRAARATARSSRSRARSKPSRRTAAARRWWSARARRRPAARRSSIDRQRLASASGARWRCGGSADGFEIDARRGPAATTGRGRRRPSPGGTIAPDDGHRLGRREPDSARDATPRAEDLEAGRLSRAQYRRNRPTSLPWMRTRLGGRMRTS